MNFVGKIVAGIAAQSLRIARKDEAVQHERIHREQRALFDHPAINLRVAIGDPALAVGADAGEAVVLAAAPDRIGIEQPEWRRISSGREVDVKVGLFRAQFADQMDGGVEVAVELASFDDLVRVAGAVELELVHAIFLDHVEARIAEVAIVFRPGQRESAFVGFESLRAGRSQTLLLRPVVAAPRRKPDAGRRAVTGRGLRHFRQAVGKTGIEFPESRGIVPAIVEEKAVELDAALLGQLLAETLHHGDRALLVVAVEISQVVPGVVMQKSSIRMSAFEFHIFQEVAAQLRGVSHADHGGIGHALAGLQRKFAREPAGNAIGADATFRQRMLEAQEPGSGGDGRSFHMAGDRRLRARPRR